MDIQMKGAMYKLSDPISTLSSLDISKTTGDSSRVQEDAAMWLSPHLIREPAKAAWSHLVTVDKNNPQQEGNVRT